MSKEAFEDFKLRQVKERGEFREGDGYRLLQKGNEELRELLSKYKNALVSVRHDFADILQDDDCYNMSDIQESCNSGIASITEALLEKDKEWGESRKN